MWDRLRQVLALAALGLGLCSSAWAQAAPSAGGAPRAVVAVLPPHASPILASVAGGARLWLAAQLADGGLRVVDASTVDAAVAGLVSDTHPQVSGQDAPAIARRTGATLVYVTSLSYEDGRVVVWERVHDGSTGEPLGAAHADGPLAALGTSISKAAQPLFTGLGWVGRPPEPPALGDLLRWERAGKRLAGGQLADAWRTLDGDTTSTARRLQDRIERAARAPEVPFTERSRLASVRGTHDSDWLEVRHGLAEGGGAAVLVAGAESAMARADAKHAAELYDQAAQLAPKDLEIARGRARALAATDRAADARAAYQRVLALAPDDAEAHLALAGDAGLDAGTRARHELAAGRLQAERLEAARAKQSFEEAARLDASLSGEARLGEARLNARLGNDGEALLGYEELASSGDTSPQVAEGLGAMRLRSGDAKGAQKAYADAVAKAPDDPDAQLGLGLSLLGAGAAKDAVAPLERAHALRPDDGPSRRVLARAYHLTGRTEEALKLLDPESVPAPERAGVLVDAAKIQEDAGHPDAAKLALQRAVRIEPDDVELHTALAHACSLAGDADAAHAEEARVAALRGGETAGRGSAAAGGHGAAHPSEVQSGQLGPLVDSFPLTFPGGNVPIGSVVFLGVEPPRDPLWRLRSWLLPRAVDTAAMGRAVQAALAARYHVIALTDLPELAKPALARVRALGTSRDDLSLVNDVSGADALFLVALRPQGALRPFDGPATPLELEARFAGGRAAADVFILGNEASLRDPSAYLAWNPRAALPWGVVLALLLFPVVRGWGTLVVKLDYQTQKGSKGFFSIQLSRKPGKARREGDTKPGRSKSARYTKRARHWSRLARHMVGHETRMPLVPARRWYVLVHGLLQDSNSKEVIGNYIEEREVRVERGKVTEVAFDFRLKEAPVELRLAREEGREDAQVLVAVRGIRGSLRYVRGDSAMVHLPDGTHTVLVGVDGRVFAQEVSISEHEGRALHFGLGNEADAVFTGCPEAVEPYLMGDVSGAIQALEAAGLAEPARLMRAELHKGRGEAAEAARLYEEAGQLTQAAELHETAATAASSARQFEQSAELYEQAGEYRRAAERYAAAGDHAKAAQAWEAAYEYEPAIEAYRAAGNPTKALELLEKTGGFFDAGNLALEQGDVERAIRCLQMVDLRDPDFGDACLTLSRIFGEREELPLAIDKAREAVTARGEESAPLPYVYELALLLERDGEIEEALEHYEAIVARDYHFEDAASRAAALREKATTRAEMASEAATGAAASAPRAAVEDRYEILEEIGRGGMGVVFKARDRRLGRVIALKRLPDNLRDHPTAVQLFLREARSAAALNHPNIVTLFDADQSADGHYYITMELLEGQPLDAILKRRGRLTPKDTLRLGIQTCTGLQYAHEKGIVHRDIKTSNLFFTKDRVVKIMDFGLAKMVEEVRRAATVIGGTPYYMAPEQAAGEDLDHRADLYALGVTLYELLTGRVPFTDGDVTYHHRHTPPPDPRELLPELPAPVVELVLQLMAKAPADRPSPTARVTAALERLLQGL